MKHGEKMLVCMLAGAAFCTAASAITPAPSGSPYQGIIDRNAFGLKPAPPPPDPAEANKPQAVKITLTGITTILGNKRALMKTPPPPAKPGEQSKGEQSYILTEGQREGDIEVLQIDEKAGSVKVNNAGTVVTLTFEKDGPKMPASAPAPGAPPAPMPPPPMGTPPNSMNPAANPYTPTPTGANPGVTIPNRMSRLQGSNPYATPAMGTTGVGSSSPTINAGGMTLPKFGSSMPQPQSAAPQNTPSHEEQMIMMEIEREMHKDDPRYPPPPPTPLTPGGMAPSAPPMPPGMPGGSKQPALQ